MSGVAQSLIPRPEGGSAMRDAAASNEAENRTENIGSQGEERVSDENENCDNIEFPILKRPIVASSEYDMSRYDRSSSIMEYFEPLHFPPSGLNLNQILTAPSTPLNIEDPTSVLFQRVLYRCEKFRLAKMVGDSTHVYEPIYVPAESSQSAGNAQASDSAPSTHGATSELDSANLSPEFGPECAQTIETFEMKHGSHTYAWRPVCTFDQFVQHFMPDDDVLKVNNAEEVYKWVGKELLRGIHWQLPLYQSHFHLVSYKDGVHNERSGRFYRYGADMIELCRLFQSKRCLIGCNYIDLPTCTREYRDRKF